VVALYRLIADASMVIIAPMLMLEWVLVLLLAASS
jgi:hypothetical protein